MASSMISKTTLARLAKLARIELDPKEEEKFLKDLSEILDYFKQLEELDTAKIAPMTGGTELKNIFRGDAERENTDRGAGVESFPETKNGLLKVPPVFE